MKARYTHEQLVAWLQEHGTIRGGAQTYGFPSPNSITQNLDVVLTLAFSNAGNEIFDQISKTNAVLASIKKNGAYSGITQMQPYYEVPLMYGLGTMEWYEGWDTLGTQPTEGITAASWPWRQAACAAGYNRRESRLTSQGIKEISKVKIQQAQMTMSEGFNAAILQGNVLNPGGVITDPITSPTTGRQGIDPLPALVYYQSGSSFSHPTTSFSVGGIDQSVRTWWGNWTNDMTGVTTYVGMLAAFDQMYESVCLGPGGPPKVIFTDPTTRRLLNSAYNAVYRRTLEADSNYPFDNIQFRGVPVVTDERVPNVHSGTTNTSPASGLGSAYFLNTDFLGVKYDTETNFILTDLQKPVNQDGKIGHVMWMGNMHTTNRRKQGVMGDIARTMT